MEKDLRAESFANPIDFDNLRRDAATPVESRIFFRAAWPASARKPLPAEAIWPNVVDISRQNLKRDVELYPIRWPTLLLETKN